MVSSTAFARRPREPGPALVRVARRPRPRPRGRPDLPPCRPAVAQAAHRAPEVPAAGPREVVGPALSMFAGRSPAVHLAARRAPSERHVPGARSMTMEPSACDRRSFLRTGALAAGGVALGTALARPGTAAARSSGAPAAKFGTPSVTHGVMAGDVTANSAVIWAHADRPGQMLVELATRGIVPRQLEGARAAGVAGNGLHRAAADRWPAGRPADRVSSQLHRPVRPSRRGAGARQLRHPAAASARRRLLRLHR